MTLPVIHELFESITSTISDVMGYTVHFRHGHMLEVVNQVKAMMIDPDTSKRYPLIAMRHDLKQNPVNGAVEFDAKLYIVTLSDPNYSADERYDNIFTPTLRPIFQALVSEIARSGYFEESTEDEVLDKIVFYERLFWGKEEVMGNTGKIFADWVDCIEVELTGLTALSTCYPAPPVPFIQFALVGAMKAYIYVKISQTMTDPTGLHEGIAVTVGLDEYVPIAISRNDDDHSLFLIDLTDITIEHGDRVTITMPGDTFESEAGVYLPVHLSYAVVNNV